jgi:DegV family protein with EDD domain
MSQVAVITDSCASIPDELYHELGIVMIPYYLQIGTIAKRDLVEISREEFFPYLAGAKEIPKTANPGLGDYVEAYRAAAKQTKEIVSIHMTSSGSGAYQAATIARETVAHELPSDVRIEIVDTRNVSMCHGWMTLEAARAAKAGRSLDEILALLQRMIPVTKMIQTADTLRYLYMGGRIGLAAHLAGSLLNIKPLISMRDGVIVALGTARSRLGAYRRITEIIKEDVGPGARIKLALVHVAALPDALKLRDMIQESVTCVETLITQLCPVLSVHTGPGTVGVCYFPVDPVGL